MTGLTLGQLGSGYGGLTGPTSVNLGQYADIFMVENVMLGPCPPCSPWMVGNWSSGSLHVPHGLLRHPIGAQTAATSAANSACTGKSGSQLTSCQNGYTPIQESVGCTVCSESELNQGSNPAYSSYNSICNPYTGSKTSYNSSNTNPWQFIFVNFFPAQAVQNTNVFSSSVSATTMFPCGQTVGHEWEDGGSIVDSSYSTALVLGHERDHDAAAGLLLHRRDGLRTRARHGGRRLLQHDPDGDLRRLSGARAVGRHSRAARKCRLGIPNRRARAKLWLASACFQARRLRGDARATTAVEFALVAPLVIALILGAMQIAVIYLAQAELENAAEQAARLVLTNQAPAAGSAGQTSFQSTVCGYLPALFSCSGVMVDLEAQSVSAEFQRRARHDAADLDLQLVRSGDEQLELQARVAGNARDPEGDVPVAGRRRAARPRVQRSRERNAVHEFDPGLPERAIGGARAARRT